MFRAGIRSELHGHLRMSVSTLCNNAFTHQKLNSLLKICLGKTQTLYDLRLQTNSTEHDGRTVFLFTDDAETGRLRLLQRAAAGERRYQLPCRRGDKIPADERQNRRSSCDISSRPTVAASLTRTVKLRIEAGPRVSE